MNHRIAAFVLIIAAIFIIFSCQHSGVDEDYIPVSDYYPLHTGNFIIYSVDSIHYHDETIPDDTTHYEVKELLTDTFYDNENRLNYKIERYRRNDDSEEFVLSDVWSVLGINGQIQKVENNLRDIKLVGPISIDQSWDGHKYMGGLGDIIVPEDCNNLSYLEDWNFIYSAIEEPFDINGFSFDKTVTVEESGDDNLIEYSFAKEIYAKNVGLIYKEFYHYTDNDTDCPDCTWLEHVECGYSVVMKVLEF